MNDDEPLDLAPLLDRLVTMALADEVYEQAFAQLCEGLARAGLPLMQTHLAMQTLHPLLDSVDMTWVRGRGLELELNEHTATPSEAWLRSPWYWMLCNRQPVLRQNLRVADGIDRFPVFEELRNSDATDYLAILTPFGEPETAYARRDGILTAWVTDAPTGFSEQHIAALRSIQPYIGLVAKLSKHDHTARNVVSAYIGENAGRRVLNGQIRLGDVDVIPAVIWYSDLRKSTAMAERMPIDRFLQTINAYFGCAAGAVLENGGEVLRFIGDAVLAVFSVSAQGSPESAARCALDASIEARQRLARLNALRAADSLEPLAFGLGLHVGELLYGNIGVPSRIEFSVIGRAANEVSRLESLTKAVGEPVLVSRAFKDVVDLRWRSLGRYDIKGVANGMEIFAPPQTPPWDLA